MRDWMTEVAPQRTEVHPTGAHELLLAPGRQRHADLSLAKSLGLRHPACGRFGFARGHPQGIPRRFGLRDRPFTRLGQYRDHRSPSVVVDPLNEKILHRPLPLRLSRPMAAL